MKHKFWFCGMLLFALCGVNVAVECMEVTQQNTENLSVTGVSWLSPDEKVEDYLNGLKSSGLSQMIGTLKCVFLDVAKVFNVKARIEKELMIVGKGIFSDVAWIDEDTGSFAKPLLLNLGTMLYLCNRLKCIAEGEMFVPQAMERRLQKMWPGVSRSLARSAFCMTHEGILPCFQEWNERKDNLSPRALQFVKDQATLFEKWNGVPQSPNYIGFFAGAIIAEYK